MNTAESQKLAKKYLEDVLSFFEINTDVELNFSDQVIEIAVPSNDLNSLLIGHNAETLRAMQYLLSTTLRNQNAEIYRVNLDIADYKKQRAEKLREQAREWIARVIETGEAKECALSPADRRIVHHEASEHSGVKTYSVGEGRARHLVIEKA